MIHAALTVTLCLVVITSARAAEVDDVAFARDVVYGKGGGEDLKLNFARPKNGAKNLPCIVFTHGGGWQGGDRSAHDDAVRATAARGFVSATIRYRLAPAHRFPAQVHDVKCAIRFLRAHADKFGLDPNRIAAVGFSAGAHLSMMLGVTQQDDKLEGDGGWADQSSGVQVVVSFFGPTDLAADDLPAPTRPILVNFMGGPVEEKLDAYKQASPVSYITPDDAPMLLFNGTRDPLVPHTQAYRMIEAMTNAEVPGRADIIAGAGHGWGGTELTRTLVFAAQFIDEHLKTASVPSAAPAAGGR